MSGWTADELSRIAAAEALEVAARRTDGSLRPPVTVWVVRIGDELYIPPGADRTGVGFAPLAARATVKSARAASRVTWHSSVPTMT